MTDPAVFAVAATSFLVLGVVLAARRPDWIVRWPRLVLAILAAVTIAAILALFDLSTFRPNLGVDASTEPLLPANDPDQAHYRRAVLEFGDDEVYAIALECEEIFSFECLSRMKRVSDRIARLPGVRSVTSLADVTSFRWVPEEDWIEVRRFFEEVPEDPEELAELRRRALADSVYRRTLVSEDSRAAAINVSFRKMSDAEFIAADLDGRIQEIVDSETTATSPFHIAGRPHIKVYVYRYMMRDLVLLIPLGALVMGAVLWIFTGSIRATLLPMGTALLANLWTFGSMSILGFDLNVLTVLLFPTLLSIGIIYGVHMVSRIQEESVKGPEPRAAVLRSLEHMRLPVVIAGLTTVVGFGALLITDVPAVFELGAFTMLGIASITMITLTGIPATLALLPSTADGQLPHAERGIAGPLGRWLDRALAGLAGVVQRHSGAAIVLSLAASGVAAVAVPHIVIDTDYLSYFDETAPIRVEFEAVNRLLAGAVPIYAVLVGTGPGSFREPEVLRSVAELQTRMDATPGVSRTLSFVDTLRLLNRAFHSNDPDFERVPDTRAGVTELLFMIPKSDLQRFATVNHGRANIIIRTGEVGSAAIRRVEADLRARVVAHDLPRGVRAHITGNALLLARSADGIARTQPQSVALAAITILVLITLGLGSFRLGALAMVPNLIPVLIFFGLLGLGAAALSLPTSLIGCVAMGIAIDDTVHFIARYRAERAAGMDPESAARFCGRTVGRPIAITSVLLALGFGIVGVSEFVTLREFAALTASTMLICLVTDLVLLPALLLRAKI